MKTIDNITTQLRKGTLDFIILSSLRSSSKYPREIIEDLNKHGFNLVEGTIYPLFLRLHKTGFVDYEWKEASGHPRKYYSLTSQGHIALKKYMQEWRELNLLLKKINEGDNNEAN